MNNIVTRQNANKYTWGNNCTSYVLMESETLSVKLETMPPNTKEQLHFHHQATQVFHILKGNAVLIIDEKRFELKHNESLTILPLQKHFIKNETEENLDFLVISQPNTSNDRTNIPDV